MLPRTLEPEVMDISQEAVDYNAMDHGEVNRAFVCDFLRAGRTLGMRLDEGGQPSMMLDVGTGTALIPIELCLKSSPCRVTAIDLAAEMLKLARQNVETVGLQDAIVLEQIDAKYLPYDDHFFDVVVSNSIIHHIAQPVQVLVEMLRVLRPGGLLFIRDLLRPDQLQTLDHLVATYAGDENEDQQQMFRDSLHAALTLDEIRELLDELKISRSWVSQTTDRHWTIAGRRFGR